MDPRNMEMSTTPPLSDVIPELERQIGQVGENIHKSFQDNTATTTNNNNFGEIYV